jgi:hypothetical protein
MGSRNVRAGTLGSLPHSLIPPIRYSPSAPTTSATVTRRRSTRSFEAHGRRPWASTARCDRRAAAKVIGPHGPGLEPPARSPWRRRPDARGATHAPSFAPRPRRCRCRGADARSFASRRRDAHQARAASLTRPVRRTSLRRTSVTQHQRRACKCRPIASRSTSLAMGSTAAAAEALASPGSVSREP